MIKFRASALGEIMTDAKSEELSVGAKTVITKMAKEAIYGYDEIVTSKYMDKGIQVEDESIELLNRVLFTNYSKNKERRENDWITGEPDIVTNIVTHNRIYDIKSSWSLTTFPVTSKQGEDKSYEWQCRAYMWLFDVDQSSLAYCLVPTPEHLIGYESRSYHDVDHITPELRITLVNYERDKKLEEKIKTKVEAARDFYKKIFDEIVNQHRY